MKSLLVYFYETYEFVIQLSLVLWICLVDCSRFPVDDRGTVKSVVEYFYETYGFVIQQSQWPCLQVGNQQRPNYLPMEVNIIVIFSFFINPMINICNG